MKYINTSGILDNVISQKINNTEVTNDMNYTTITSDKSKHTALLLCAFGGIMGLHDFYLGRFGSGILKLFTGNFFCFGWIIDLFKIAAGGYQDNAKAYLRR